MGLTESTVKQQARTAGEAIEESTEDVEQRLQRLFQDGKENNNDGTFYHAGQSEAGSAITSIRLPEYSTSNNMNTENYLSESTSGPLRFQPTRQRYQKYDIRNVQGQLQPQAQPQPQQYRMQNPNMGYLYNGLPSLQGGADTVDTDSFRQISDLPEFEDFMKYLEGQAQSKQTGGNRNLVETSINVNRNIPTQVPFPNFTYQKGGDGDDSNDDVTGETLGEIEFEVSESENKPEKKHSEHKKEKKHHEVHHDEDDEDEKEEEEDEDTMDILLDSDEDEEKEEKAEHETEDDEPEPEMGDLEDIIEEGSLVNSYSETSVYSEGSNANVIPFYSTPSSDHSFKYPRVRSRFNKF